MKCIVLLYQAPEDKVTLPDKASAVNKILSQATYNRWNVESLNRILSLAEAVPDLTRVVELHCTPTKATVDVLKGYLICQEKYVK